MGDTQAAAAGPAGGSGRGASMSGRHLLALALLLVVAAWTAAIGLASGQPWLGLQLEAPDEGPGLAVRSGVPGLPAGTRLLWVEGSSGGRVALQALDLTKEPDLLPDYAAWESFYARQDALAAAWRSGAVRLGFSRGGASGEVTLRPEPRRPVPSLPAVFWFQLAVGGIGALVGAWVLGLRPEDAAARCLALTGLALLLAASTAAVYSARELALPRASFAWLSSANHVGTFSFGVGLVGIFMFHPQRLVPARVFGAAAAAWGVWGLADLAWLLPSPDFAARLIILTQMLAAVGFGVWQWRRARGRPVDRAALRWVLLSFLVGCGSFVVLIVCTTLLGWLPPLSQGYAFGFFLIMYLGLALGVRRYRLFELDAWSLRVLMWLFGLLGIVLVDAMFVLLRVGEVLSLAASILLCAALYFPLRQWLWVRLRPQPPTFDELAGQIVAIALATPAERNGRWQAFLGRLFSPARMSGGPARPELAHGGLVELGLGLQVPAGHGLQPVQLWQRDQGRRLFSPDDARLAGRAHELLGRVIEAHAAQQEGARLERRRIAADLHDDLGGKLLMIA